MAKKDLRKELADLYRPPAKDPVLVDVPPMDFLVVDGEGNPNTSAAFQEAIQALYGMAYTLKFMLKKRGDEDFRVMPLEALWWNREGGTLDPRNKGDWHWTAMIALPGGVKRKDVEDARAQLRAKKDPPGLPRLRLERIEEGRAAQVMHIGPYAAEEPTIERLHAFIREEGHRPVGKHHEIYLSDPRRSAPEKLKTVVRQPVR